MGPIGSKVIEVKGQIYVYPAAPDISLRVSFFERSRSSRPKVKFMCFFFLLVPLLLPGPWADLHQIWWEGWGRPRILARGFHF